QSWPRAEPAGLRSGSGEGRRPCPLRSYTARRLAWRGLQTDALQLLRDGVVDLPGRPGQGGRYLLQKLVPRGAAEGAAAGQQLVEDHAQAEDVRAAVHPVPLTAGLLRT